MEMREVRRGAIRWLVHAGVAPVSEVRLGCGRRADLLGVDAQGRLTLVEIKVSLADLRGDRKWPEYLDWCDRYFWAVPYDLPRRDLESEAFAPACTGVLVADAYGAALVRDAPWLPLAAARRKAQTLRLARQAAGRLALLEDPGLELPAD